MNRQTNDKEMIVVTTQITLATPSLRFAEELFDVISSNKEYFSRYMDWPKFVNQLADTEEFLNSSRSFQQKNNEQIYIILFEQRPVGVVSLHEIDLQNKTACLGYWLDKNRQGNGIISNSINKLMHVYSDKGSVIHFFIKCTTFNERSNNVAKGCGFHYDGILSQAESINGVLYDQNIYSRFF